MIWTYEMLVDKYLESTPKPHFTREKFMARPLVYWPGLKHYAEDEGWIKPNDIVEFPPVRWSDIKVSRDDQHKAFRGLTARAKPVAKAVTTRERFITWLKDLPRRFRSNNY